MRALRVVVAAVAMVVMVVAGAGALWSLPGAAASPTCDVSWSSGAVPSASGTDTVCVTGDVTLSSSESWGGLVVEADATLTVLSTVDCSGAQPITLSAGGAVDIEASGSLELETSCAAGGDSTLEADGGLTVSGQLDVNNCDADMVTPHCGGQRHIIGSVANAGTVTIDGTAADVTGATWDNAGTVAMNDHGTMTALAGSLVFTNETGGLVNGVDNVGGTRLSLEAGDSFHQAGGSVRHMLVGLTNADLAVSAAGAADFEAFGNVDWTGGFTDASQSIWVPCVESTTLHVAGAAVNNGIIYLGDEPDEEQGPCTGAPSLDIDGPDAGLVDSGRIDGEGPASINGAATLSVPGILDVGSAVTLDAPPADLSDGTLTTGEWDIESGGSVSWPTGASSVVSTLAGKVDFVGPGTLPNLDLKRVSSSGSLGIGGGEMLTTDAGGLTNDGVVEVGEGRLTVPAGASYVQVGGETQIDANGTVQPGTGLHMTGGTLVGYGTVDGSLVASGGVVDASFGRPFTVTGSYTQRKAAELKVEESTNPPTDGFYSVMDAGSATLAGTLSAVLSWDPAAGTTDQVIDAPGGITGRFTATSCLSYDCAPAYSSTSASIVLGRQHTSTTVTLSRPGATYSREGDTRVSVKVRGLSFAHPGVSGRVHVLGQGRTLCSFAVTVASGSCNLSPEALGAGTRSVRAVFVGNSGFDSSSSASAQLVVVPSRTQTSLRLSTRRVKASDESRLRFTATVTPSGRGPVTGLVVIKLGMRTLCSARVEQVRGGSKATCALSARIARAGTYAARAVYRRSTDFRHSSSGLHTFTVTG